MALDRYHHVAGSCRAVRQAPKLACPWTSPACGLGCGSGLPTLTSAGVPSSSSGRTAFVDTEPSLVSAPSQAKSSARCKWQVTRTSVSPAHWSTRSHPMWSLTCPGRNGAIGESSRAVSPGVPAPIAPVRCLKFTFGFKRRAEPFERNVAQRQIGGHAFFSKFGQQFAVVSDEWFHGPNTRDDV
jgi:hypothetical protein